MITLVLGGTRSGKSAIAEAIAAAHDPVTYLATGRIGDPDFAARVAAHRDRRPASWTTLECPEPSEVPAALAALDGCVLLDSLGTWVAGHPTLHAIDAAPLVAALAARTRPTIVVSEEVGLSIHAPTAIGRDFVDALGQLNHAVSAIADRVLLVVAGRPVELPPFGPPSC